MTDKMTRQERSDLSALGMDEVNLLAIAGGAKS